MNLGAPRPKLRIHLQYPGHPRLPKISPRSGTMETRRMYTGCQGSICQGCSRSIPPQTHPPSPPKTRTRRGHFPCNHHAMNSLRIIPMYSSVNSKPQFSPVFGPKSPWNHKKWCSRSQVSHGPDSRTWDTPTLGPPPLNFPRICGRPQISISTANRKAGVPSPRWNSGPSYVTRLSASVNSFRIPRSPSSQPASPASAPTAPWYAHSRRAIPSAQYPTGC